MSAGIGTGYRRGVRRDDRAVNGDRSSLERLEDTVSVQQAGIDNLTARVAADGVCGGGGAVHVDVAGQNATGTVDFDGTRGWQSWETRSAGRISLTEGEHVVRVTADGSDWNFDSRDFEYTGGEDGENVSADLRTIVFDETKSGEVGTDRAGDDRFGGAYEPAFDADEAAWVTMPATVEDSTPPRTWWHRTAPWSRRPTGLARWPNWPPSSFAPASTPSSSVRTPARDDSIPRCR